MVPCFLCIWCYLIVSSFLWNFISGNVFGFLSQDNSPPNMMCPCFCQLLGYYQLRNTSLYCQSLDYFRKHGLYKFCPQLGDGGLWLQIFKFLLKIIVIINVSPIATARHEWITTLSSIGRVFFPGLHPRTLSSKGLNFLYGIFD